MYADYVPLETPELKILVIDHDDATANIVATSLAPRRCEVIFCRDMALAEAATDLTEFDLIMVSPSTTGVDGVEGLAVADFLAARNPSAVTTLLLPQEDGDLKSAVEQRGRFRVLGTPLDMDEIHSLVADLDSTGLQAVVL